MSGADAHGRALTAGVLVAAVWGVSFTVQKAAYSALGPGGFLFGRAIVMAACALALLRWRGSALWPRLARAEWATLLLVTATGPVLHITMVTWGIHWSTAFSSALIMACGPVFTLVLLRLIRGTPMRPLQLAGVATAFSGVLLFMSEKLMLADWRASGGDLTMLLASIVFSLYTIWVTPLVTRHGGPEVMCWATLLASPLMLAGNALAAWDAPFAAAGPLIWAGFFWAVLVSAFLGWMLWGWVNAVLGVARSAPLLYLVPPLAGVVAWLTVGEAFGARKLAGAALALAGVALTQRRTLQGKAG